jgi:hypothetical protein
VLDTPEESHDTSQNRSQRVDMQQPSSGGIASPDESPELLRWRADILLDEMMLGAVDIAAGRPEVASPDIATPVTPTTDFPTDNLATDSGAFEGGPRPPDVDRRSFVDDGAPSRKRVADPDPWLAGDASSRDWLGRSVPQAPAAQGSQAPHSQTPNSQVQDYRPEASGEAQSGNSGRMLRPPSASAALADAQAESTDALEPSASDGRAGVAAWRVGTSEQSDSKPDLRSNLLPRESQFDARSHFHEIDRLEAEVAATLPTEHEWSVRSRHLLAKATDILQNSPERSAEVDYYLQQVRSILERAQQTYQWSLVYAKRLKLYLGSWALFSIVMITACLLYAGPLAEAIVNWFPAVTDYGAQNLIASIITVFAGTLGASAGALRNMVVYRSAGRGFVDRKYSLRGLLLPMMAGFFGFMVYLLFGIIFYFADINPVQNLLVVGVPVLLALAFGLVQESLYGTAG